MLFFKIQGYSLNSFQKLLKSNGKKISTQVFMLQKYLPFEIPQDFC